jgi:hypothetical protein
MTLCLEGMNPGHKALPLAIDLMSSLSKGRSGVMPSAAKFVSFPKDLNFGNLNLSITRFSGAKTAKFILKMVGIETFFSQC